MEADSILIGSALDYYGLIGARGTCYVTDIMMLETDFRGVSDVAIDHLVNEIRPDKNK